MSVASFYIFSRSKLHSIIKGESTHPKCYSGKTNFPNSSIGNNDQSILFYPITIGFWYLSIQNFDIGIVVSFKCYSNLCVLALCGPKTIFLQSP